MNTFAITLQDQRQGALANELSISLNQLVAAVRSTGRPGHLTLKLSITPTAGSDGTTVTLTDDVTVKNPKPKKPSSLFFTCDDGRLTRENPNQQSLPLRTVETREEPLRKAN